MRFGNGQGCHNGRGQGKGRGAGRGCGNGMGQGRGQGRGCGRGQGAMSRRGGLGLGLNREGVSCRFSAEEIAANLKEEITNVEAYLAQLKGKLGEVEAR